MCNKLLCSIWNRLKTWGGTCPWCPPGSYAYEKKIQSQVLTCQTSRGRVCVLQGDGKALLFYPYTHVQHALQSYSTYVGTSPSIRPLTSGACIPVLCMCSAFLTGVRYIWLLWKPISILGVNKIRRYIAEINLNRSLCSSLSEAINSDI